MSLNGGARENAFQVCAVHFIIQKVGKGLSTPDVSWIKRTKTRVRSDAWVKMPSRQFRRKSGTEPQENY